MIWEFCTIFLFINFFLKSHFFLLKRIHLLQLLSIFQVWLFTYQIFSLIYSMWSYLACFPVFLKKIVLILIPWSLPTLSLYAKFTLHIFWKNFLSSSFNFSLFSGKRQKISFILLNAKTFFLFVSLIYFSLLFYSDERGLCYFSIFIFIFIIFFVQNEKKNHDFFMEKFF